MTTGLRVLLYALVAATSPLALGATVVVLTSGRGRLNGTAFALGVLLGQSIVCVALALLGGAWVPDGSDGRTSLFIAIDVAFGIALLVAAVHVRRHVGAPGPGPGSSARTQAIQDRLERLSPGTALSTGIALGFGGPKRLGVTLLAAATIAAADVTTNDKLALSVGYVLIATVLVWLPVVLYLVFDRAATDWIERAEHGIAEHRSTVVFYPSLVLGAVLLINAVVLIVGD